MKPKMKALVYDLSVPRYLATQVTTKIFSRRYFSRLGCLRLKEIPIPDLSFHDWALIKTEACGICGSDLSLLTGKESFSMEPYSSFPAVLGHEAVGRIAKTGVNVDGFKEGDRVAVDNILPCVTREITPACGYCQTGDYSLCENFTGGKLSPGPVNGYNSSVGGGFGEYFIAHKSQLFPIPENTNVSRAVLTDPLASALQPAATHLPKESDTVLVYGGGIIGILLINSLRALGFKGRLIAVARHDFQALRAKEAGADEVIKGHLFNRFAELTGAKKMKPRLGKPVFEGGVNIVFDCVGSPQTIDNSLRFLKRRGKLVIVGTAGNLKKVDASPIWFKEIQITGSSMYSHVNINGQRMRTYRAAIDLINSGSVKTDGLVTHWFRIDKFDKAINVALNKRAHESIKVIFRF